MSGSTINLAPDFGARAADYRRHRQGFPEAFFERLAALGLLRPGLTAVDLGTGTGSVALGLARRGLSVVGVDFSAAMLEAARQNATGLPVRWLEGRAEHTGLEASAFDLVTAGQCWHWFDRQAARAEVRRLLRPSGTLVVAHLDWVELPGAVLEAALRVVGRFGQFPERALLGSFATYPRWLDELAAGGFAVESFSFDVALAYDHAALAGRLRASAALCELGAETLDRFDDAYAREVAPRFAEPLRVPHRVYAVLARPAR